MARQLVVLALVLIVLVDMVSADALSAGGNPASAPTEGSANGSVASSSTTS
ncbi:hypothetical protein Gogos_002669 [Gossypium gossypioides]|uniref:Uncharacterized protein n=1 Tax=Gossypium gossypioides TaxID=34282 RepID=A0A7J9CJM4_GOSGO|nr:hypothetical protein [Gossypium gossypioides]